MVITARRTTMTLCFKRLSILGGVALVLGTVSFASAQPPAGRRGPMMYDVKTETTVNGTVEAVDIVSGSGGRGRGGMGGAHLTVKTGAEALEVHLGPVAYLAEKKIMFSKGDAVEILGSRVTINEKPVLIAREIKKAGDTWTLRDASGHPLWSGGWR
jgi:hypothetical protein